MKKHITLTFLFTFLLYTVNIVGQRPQRIISDQIVNYTTDSLVITPTLTSKAIVNPGKGWVLYGKVQEQPKELLELASLGYVRYQWGDIEPSEGIYRWDIIDKDIHEWAKAGKSFAFGVMCANTHSRKFWVSPKWVFDAGAKFDTFELNNPKLNTLEISGTKLVPVFDDSVFMDKLSHFIRALALHYDGNPNIAFIDIRSYGNWGEGHMYPFGKPDISATKFKEHIQIHREAFRKTLLVIAAGKKQEYMPIYDWAVSVRISLRVDGICGNCDGSEVKSSEGKLPAIFELYGDFSMLKDFGWWDGIKDKDGRGFRLDECIEKGKASYCDLSRGKQTGLKLLKSEPELVTKINNRLGYHFVLTEAIFPSLLSSSKPFNISLKWENLGVSRIFIPAKVSFALISTNGSIIQVCDAKASIPDLWKPDTHVNIQDELLFRNVKNGEYILAIGIRQPNDELKPSIKLGVDLKLNNGWYELGFVGVN